MDKKQTFQQIISDFIENDLKEVLPRLVKIPSDQNKVISILGPRRSGKTYVLYDLINQLRKDVERNRIIYINFEDDRLFPLELSDMDLFLKGYYELFPGNKDVLVYFFFDEIQEVENWEKFIRRIFDQENCRIFLTGSSSKMLSREIASSLRGRTIPFEVFPLSFKEFLLFKNIDVNPKSSKGEATLVHETMNYLKQGGFPELIFTEERFHRKIIGEYLDLMIYRDLTERFSINNPYLIKYLLKHFLVNIGNPITFNKIFNDLKSQGFKVGKNTVFEYTSYLEEAFILFSVKIFSPSVRIQAVNPNKIYGIDAAYKHAMSISGDIGRIFENTVFLELRRKGIEPSYLMADQEVDFYWENGRMINASIDISNPKTRERELRGLFKAMEKYDVNSSELITRDRQETIEENGKTVFIKPLWKFLLEA